MDYNSIALHDYAFIDEEFHNLGNYLIKKPRKDVKKKELDFIVPDDYIEYEDSLVD